MVEEHSRIISEAFLFSQLKFCKEARRADVLATRLAKQEEIEKEKAQKAAARADKRKAMEEAAAAKAAERAARPPKKQKGAPKPPAAGGDAPGIGIDSDRHRPELSRLFHGDRSSVA